jgi:hypothetical protein
VTRFLTKHAPVVLLAVVWLAGMSMLYASAHSFYDPYCCNDKDCAPIKTAHVKPVAGGYLVRLRPEDHVGLSKAVGVREYLVPYADAKPSPDGGFHACILPYMPDTMRCFYAPPMGS